MLGTALAQRSVKGVYRTKKQGSTINCGQFSDWFRCPSIAESESATAWFGVPTVLALAAHQIVFSKFKRDNLAKGIRGSSSQRNNLAFTVQMMPQNYLMNQRIRPSQLGVETPNSIVTVELPFLIPHLCSET